LKFWDVQTGTGTAVTSGSTITVFYTGWLLDGTIFDSARTTGSPATFPLSNLIQGWQQGLLGMQPGGIRRLYIPSELAYGSTGSGSVPPDADLVFEIKLVFTT
jgi:FKBP-type peptidyl-prolyl cis-trans isomerase